VEPQCLQALGFGLLAVPHQWDSATTDPTPSREEVEGENNSHASDTCTTSPQLRQLTGNCCSPRRGHEHAPACSPTCLEPIRAGLFSARLIRRRWPYAVPAPGACRCSTQLAIRVENIGGRIRAGVCRFGLLLGQPQQPGLVRSLW